MGSDAVRLLVASSNRGKVAEITRLLAGLPVEVVGLDQYPDLPDTDEPHDTFRANAEHKALLAAQSAGCLALADDSGLEVVALGGRPGVLSARYGRDDAERIGRLLAELDGVSDRRARFVCVVALAGPQGILGAWEGTVEGVITEAPRGTNGFGFDPVFLHGDRTLAELTSDEKNAVSHRGRALRAFAADLPGLLHGLCSA
ncbi:MAG: RdgB/HAM1 family non-canonical purine NTP pyrophosphatase [Armatimonadetes bacterium]|nr:RdgB/HAM1 family non-canonical purine NTP pyrophosphatase [Armatimonadota bacterium]